MSSLKNQKIHFRHLTPLGKTVTIALAIVMFLVVVWELNLALDLLAK